MEIGFYIVCVAFIVALVAFFWKLKSQQGMEDESQALKEVNGQLKISLAKAEERLASNASEKDVIVSFFKSEQQRLLTELQEERAHLGQAKQSLESLRAYHASQQERFAEQRVELQETQEKFKRDFELIASKILEEKSLKFTETNRVNLDNLLRPLKENIKAFEDKVEKVYKSESDERNVLKGEISKLMELNTKISQEAHNLTNALKADVKKLGNWGEVILDRILEASGLTEGEGYTKQLAYIAESGAQFQPDVVVTLPDKKQIIIDAKVSLIAYERMMSCATEAERKLHLKSHISSVRAHISGLGAKNYQALYGINSPDFVLLFIPIESSFAIAVQNDVDLFDFAWNKRVVIVTPSTLLATLRTIASVWKQRQQTKNALEIATRAGALYDKFVLFTEDLKKVGDALERSREAYHNAMNKLSTGTGNLTSRVESLKKLGAKTSKQIDEKLLEDDSSF